MAASAGRLRRPGEGAGVVGVPQLLVRPADQAEVDDDRRQAHEQDEDDGEHDQDLTALAVPPSRASDAGHHSIRISTLDARSSVAPKASGQSIR